MCLYMARKIKFRHLSSSMEGMLHDFEFLGTFREISGPSVFMEFMFWSLTDVIS